jgi:hypothetical protein
MALKGARILVGGRGAGPVVGLAGWIPPGACPSLCKGGGLFGPQPLSIPRTMFMADATGKEW